MKKLHLLLALGLLVSVGVLAIVRGVRAGGPDDGVRQGTASTGLVESIHFHNVAAPRLVGATGPGR